MSEERTVLWPLQLPPDTPFEHIAIDNQGGVHILWKESVAIHAISAQSGEWLSTAFYAGRKLSIGARKVDLSRFGKAIKE